MGASVANNLLCINPYKEGGIWMFDDDRFNIKKELFVGDINKMIDQMVVDAGIKKAQSGFRAIFGAEPFSGMHMLLERVDDPPEDDKGFFNSFLNYFSVKEAEEIRKDVTGFGATYYCPQYNLTGWLCPVLFQYFEEAPVQICVRAEPLG